MRYRGTAFTQNAVFKEVNRQLTQIGGDFGVKSPSIFTQHSFGSDNRAINWENDLYAVGVSGIWKYDVATGGPWALFHAFADRYTNAEAETFRLGLTAASVNGEPRLVTGYPTNAGAPDSMRIVSITPTGTFESPEITLLGTNFASQAECAIGECISYRNSIVFGNNSEMVEVSLEDFSTSLAGTSASSNGSSLIVFRDRVFDFRTNGNNWDLRRKDGTTGTLVARFGSGFNGVDGFARSNRGAIIQADDNTLVLFMFIDGNAGGEESHRCVVMEFPPGTSTDSFTATEVTAQVMPSELRFVSTLERTSRITARLDLLTNGPDNPIYELEFYRLAASEGNSVSLYKYTPTSGTQLEFIDAGLDGYGYSTVPYSETCGKNIWPGSGTVNVSPPVLAVDGANINATFDIFGPASLSGQVALELLFDKEGFATTTRGSLESTDVGSLSGNVAIGLSPGDTVTVVWKAAIDGIGIVDNPKVAGLVYAL